MVNFDLISTMLCVISTIEEENVESEEKIPSREECEERINRFVDVTTTNSAEAQQFLQENQWNLEQAVSAFFAAYMDEPAAVAFPTSSRSGGSEENDLSVEVVEQLFGEGKKVTSEPPPTLQFLSWNLDGLDDRCLKKRMGAVVGVVQRLEPDVIFFQEVINEVADYLERKLPEYHCQKGDSSDGYYNVTFIRVLTVRCDSHITVPYTGSRMGRHYVLSRVHIGERHFAFLNTHLESGAEFAQERTSQLRTAFKAVKNIPPEVTVVVGGDLNLRDGEVDSNVPYGWTDAWAACGSRQELRWTWDTRRNTNKGFGPNGPRARFDRVYIRPEPLKVSTKDFGLVGAKRAAQTQMFPSDHWGLFICFQLKHSC